MRASIITPTFNAIAYVEDCVRNVVAQGSTVVEHIISDGGSTDGTVEVIERLALTFPHIKYIPGPDRGQSDAMNKAIAIAKGDVLGILNVDDFYEPDAVAHAVAELEQMSSPAIVVGDCRIINISGETVLWNRPKDLRLESLLCDTFLLPLPANPSAYFYSRAVHDQIGGYDVNDHYAMDVEFILNCVVVAQARYVPEHWGNFRLIPGAKTHDDAKGAERLTEIIARHKTRLSAAQRTRMRNIYRTKRITASFGNFLRKAGLRR